MIAEPQLDKEKLLKTLEENFDIKIINADFTPAGEVSWGYKITTESSKRYFLKISSNVLNEKPYEFIYKLFTECKIDNLVHPVLSKNQEIVWIFESYYCVLFNFIDGKTEAQIGLNNAQLEEVGAILARIHRSIQIIGAYPVKEEFNNPFSKEFLELYLQLDHVETKDETILNVVKIYEDYKEIFYQEFDRLNNLGERLKSKKLEFVNCHGEPSPGNIMVDKSGKLYLIDWDEPIFAPKEKDLLFFTNRIEPVLTGYKKYSEDTKLNQEVLEYYSLLWNVGEICDWGIRVLVQKNTMEENKHNLEKLIEFLDYSGLGKKFSNFL